MTVKILGLGSEMIRDALIERIAEPCGVHLPQLADVFGTKG